MGGPHPAPHGLMAGAPAPKAQDKPLRPGQKGYKAEPLPPGSCAGSLGWITIDFTGWADYPGTYTDVACKVCGIVFRVAYSVGTILDALAWAGRQSYSVPIHGPVTGQTEAVEGVSHDMSHPVAGKSEAEGS